MRRFVLIITVIIISTLGCKKTELPGDISQAVIFEFEYINYAWVYTHFGWMIDDEGDVRGYSLPDKWNFPDEEGYLKKNELIENLAQTDTCFFSVSDDEMLEYFDTRFDLLQGRMDTSDIFMADAGIGALYIYVWDKELEKYKRQLLASSGDISVTNMHPKAKSLIAWLKDIGKKTNRFYWWVP